jgi:hypothetical protein
MTSNGAANRRRRLLPPRRAKPKRAGLLRLRRRCSSFGFGFGFDDWAAARHGGREFEIERQVGTCLQPPADTGTRYSNREQTDNGTGTRKQQWWYRSDQVSTRTAFRSGLARNRNRIAQICNKFDKYAE